MNKNNDKEENNYKDDFFINNNSKREKKDYLTVSEFLDGINIFLKENQDFVAGEVTEFKPHDKWISFSLKDRDDNSILRCFLSVWIYRKIGVLLEDGMQIKIGGFPRVYKPAGTFSFNVESIEPLGEGSLKKAYELLIKKFEQEGLFARKRNLPEFIKRIGVISSKSGVVIHDFLKNLKPLGLQIKFFDSRVEGVDAVPQIVEGIKWLNKKEKDLDLIILMRGGGSLESMQAFNNESVCREIFASKIPVLCGIGHEVDVPVACLVSDEYVSTPTATAFKVNTSWDRLISGIPILQKIIFSKFDISINRANIFVPNIRKEILLHFTHSLSDIKIRASNISGNIFSGFRRIFYKFGILSDKVLGAGVSRIQQKIKSIEENVLRYNKLLLMADPERNLRLGYSIVFDNKGKVVKDVKEIKRGQKISTRLSGGEVESIVENIHPVK